MVKCPDCNGCMVARGNYFEKGNVSAFVRWYCRFCKKYYMRKGRGLELKEVKKG